MNLLTAAEKTIICENKIPIHTFLNPNLHGFCISLYLKAGILYEKEGFYGATHLWEHIIYRKLKLLTDGDFHSKLDLLGIRYSAGTYKEFVHIKFVGARDKFEAAVDFLEMIFTPSKISLKELELERKRVKAEIREDGEKDSIDYFSNKIVWEGTSLTESIAGNTSSLNRIGVGKIMEIESTILSKGNVFIYVTGAASDDNINYLKDKMDTVEINDSSKVRDNMAQVPKNFFNRKGEIAVKESYYSYVRFSFDIDMSKYSKMELDLLYDILFTNNTAILFRELSERRGLIYDFDSIQELYSNVGNIFFSFEIEKRNIYTAVECVVELLNEMKSGLGKEHLYGLSEYTTNVEMLLDDMEALNWNLAYEKHILNLDYESLRDRKELYSKVTIERIEEISREIFTRDNLVLTLKSKKSSFKYDLLKEMISKLDI